MTPRDANGFGKRPEGSPGKSTARRLGEYLVAILGGNVLFLILEPYLPPLLQHHTFRVDWGLGVDFGLCAVLYGVVRLAGLR